MLTFGPSDTEPWFPRVSLIFFVFFCIGLFYLLSVTKRVMGISA